MKINIPLHTIIMMVGPSSSGKTTLCKEYMIPSIKASYPELNIQYLSSDAIRSELLGHQIIDKSDIEMNHVSEFAFKILEAKLNALTSFPVKSEIIILDTTALSEKFRNEIILFAKKVNYNLLPMAMDYDTRSDYFVEDNEVSNKLVSTHIKRFKQEVLKTLSKKNYGLVVKIKHKNFSEYEFEVPQYEFYRSHFIEDNETEFCVISDIHGCLNELKEIINKNECEIIDDLIVGNKTFIVQDYCDKGYNIRETIEFIYKNYKNGKILPLASNHENYIYKRIKGEIKALAEEFENDWFETIPLLENDLDLQAKFIELFENSKHFYYNKYFFVNHAPCKSIYLGKIDNTSLKAQRNFSYPKQRDFNTSEEYVETLETKLNFLREEAIGNSKPIIWGHIQIKNTMSYKNIHMIDTGCVSKNKLSCISFDKYGRYFFKTVSSENNPLVVKTELYDIFRSASKTFNLELLEKNDLKRIKYLVKDKINFISGTMCPANKKDGNLESLEDGLLYYKEKNINKVILQPKFMGSNCVLYINKDIEKCYATSRNGFKIKRVDLTNVYIDVYNKLEPIFNDAKASGKEIEYILIHGELMPWSALGKGLIDHTFKSVELAVKNELELLKDNGFWDAFNKIGDSDEYHEFNKLSNTMSKKELIEKFNYRLFGSYKYFQELSPNIQDSESYKIASEIYSKQLELFGTECEPYFLPFSLLKYVYTDNTEKLFFNESNIEIFKSISDQEYCVIDFTIDNWLETASEFYNKITGNLEMEGIVIKPEIVYNKGVAPFIKVRNPNYLTLVYGYDYKKQHKFKKLYDRKHINKKLKVSIKEFELGKTMLEVPYNEINDDNQKLINAYCTMILEEKQAETLDPRL